MHWPTILLIIGIILILAIVFVPLWVVYLSKAQFMGWFVMSQQLKKENKDAEKKREEEKLS